VEERSEERSEELISNAAVAGVGAVLVGVGVALAYLLGHKRPRFRRIPRAYLTIEENGTLSRYDDLEIEVEEGDPPAAVPVMWIVTNRGPRRILAFENFERRHDDKKITPLEKEPDRRIRSIPPGATNRIVVSQIDRDAVADVLGDGQRDRHEYKYDIWVDRVRQADPEIAIIRR
jgi:hypothetical protein